MCLSHQAVSITWYWPKGRWPMMTGTVTAGLAESNGSLLQGLWLCMCASLWAWWEVLTAHRQCHDYACCHLQSSQTNCDNSEMCISRHFGIRNPHVSTSAAISRIAS